MRKLLGLPIIWLGALSAILLGLNAFSIVPISFGWATAPLWVPMLAVCGIAGCVVGIVACIVFGIVAICVGVMGLGAAIVVFVCALILALIVIIAILATAGAVCAGAVATMYLLCGGNANNAAAKAAADFKQGAQDKKAKEKETFDDGVEPQQPTEIPSDDAL